MVVQQNSTDITMQNEPLGFLGWTKQRKPSGFSSKVDVTTGSAGVAVSSGSIPFLVYGKPAFSGEVDVTTGSTGVAVAVVARPLYPTRFWVQREGHVLPYALFDLSSGEIFSSASYVNVIASNFKIEHPTVLEIYELSEDDSDDEYEGKIAAESKSVSYAVTFAKNILKKCKTNPEVDLHPDGEVSLSWRSNRGIINIAFGEDGIATYAAYFALLKETHKGRFSVSSVTPETVINIIGQIEK